jgi:perosamine synthetase
MSSTHNETREVPFARPWLTDDDRARVLAVLEGHILTHGPEGKAFEQEFAEFMGGDAHCVSVSSCMAALHLSWLQLGVGPGDEVIVPAQTHAATAHAVEWTGATPVFVDCELSTGNVTADAVRDAVTPRTRAISVVHYAGIPCDMPAIKAVADEQGLALVEDAALAVGARWDGKHVGLFGEAGCFSFYTVKHLTTAEGGMFVSRDPEIAQAVAKLRAFGVDRTHGERSVPGMYDVTSLGLNYRMSEPQAALGRGQLERVAENLAQRSANFAAIRDTLVGRTGIKVVDAADARASNSHYCLTLLEESLAGKRTDLIAMLNADGVGTSIYYPQPVPRMTYYRQKYGYDAGRWPNATAISDRSIALPVGPHLEDGDAEFVGRTVAAALERLA